MEVGEGKDQRPELCLLCAALQDVIIELPICPPEVSLPKDIFSYLLSFGPAEVPALL